MTPPATYAEATRKAACSPLGVAANDDRLAIATYLATPASHPLKRSRAIATQAADERRRQLQTAADMIATAERTSPANEAPRSTR